MIKSTCNRADQARMRKLGLEGLTVEEISKGMSITLDCVLANMKGHKAGSRSQLEEVELVTVGGNDPAPAVDNRSPQQKAADTRKAKKKAAAAEAPDFTE